MTKLSSGFGNQGPSGAREGGDEPQAPKKKWLVRHTVVTDTEIEAIDEAAARAEWDRLIAEKSENDVSDTVEDEVDVYDPEGES